MLMNCVLTLSQMFQTMFKHREIHMLTGSDGLRHRSGHFIILGSLYVCFMHFLAFVLSFAFFPVFCFPSRFLELLTS